jgi:HTH-type transcriptional regulator / antitoxin MqsA
MNSMPNTCISCASPLIREVVENRTVDIGRYAVPISADRFFRCDACGEEFQTGEQAREFDEKVVGARRAREGLLPGADIRQVRLALGLSQADFENALGIGPKTVVRWENDVTIQSKAIDDVIRLVAFDPDNLRYLVHVRNAAKAELIDRKVAPKAAAAVDEPLRTAIHDGIERSNINTVDTERMVDAIFGAIKDYKERKLSRVAQESSVAQEAGASA